MGDVTEPTTTDLAERIAGLRNLVGELRARMRQVEDALDLMAADDSDSRIRVLELAVSLLMEERRRDTPPPEDPPRNVYAAERYIDEHGRGGEYSERAAFIIHQWRQRQLARPDDLAWSQDTDWSESGWLNYQRAKAAGTWVGDIWEGVPGAE